MHGLNVTHCDKMYNDRLDTLKQVGQARVCQEVKKQTCYVTPNALAIFLYCFYSNVN